MPSRSQQGEYPRQFFLELTGSAVLQGRFQNHRRNVVRLPRQMLGGRSEDSRQDVAVFEVSEGGGQYLQDINGVVHEFPLKFGRLVGVLATHWRQA